jgi:hypothetical protein
MSAFDGAAVGPSAIGKLTLSVGTRCMGQAGETGCELITCPGCRLLAEIISYPVWHRVAWVGGMDALSPTRVRDYAMRT